MQSSAGPGPGGVRPAPDLTNREGSPVAELPGVQRYAAVLWPSFLFAAAATVVFFAFLDPASMLECKGAPPLSRTAAYSLGFFMFWLLTAGSSAVSYYFLSTRVPPRKPIDEPELD